MKGVQGDGGGREVEVEDKETLDHRRDVSRVRNSACLEERDETGELRVRIPAHSFWSGCTIMALVSSCFLGVLFSR